MLARVRRPTRAEIEAAERHQREAREFEEQLTRRESYFLDEDTDMGRYDSNDTDNEEEEEDEILLSPRKRRVGVREEWEDDPME